jgi:hypothetical protein
LLAKARRQEGKEARIALTKSKLIKKGEIYMIRKSTITKLLGLFGLVIGLLVPLNAQAQDSGFVRRYAANFAAFGAELTTTLAPLSGGAGGAVIYNKNFFTADDINTLYVTISGTSDAHRGARLMIACLLDGNPCNPNGGTPFINFAPTGWVNARRLINYNLYFVGTGYGGDGGGGAGDAHDNAMNYTWCTPFNGPPGSHNVKVKMASAASPDTGSSGANVFIEQVHFFIDGARVAKTDNGTNVCTSDPVDSTVATSPSVTTAPNGTLIDTTTFVPFTDPVAIPVTVQLP